MSVREDILKFIQETYEVFSVYKVKDDRGAHR
jgi:hypothetical protein